MGLQQRQKKTVSNNSMPSTVTTIIAEKLAKPELADDRKNQADDSPSLLTEEEPVCDTTAQILRADSGDSIATSNLSRRITGNPKLSPLEFPTPQCKRLI